MTPVKGRFTRNDSRSAYLERGITEDFASDTGKSCERAVATLDRPHLSLSMNTNESARLIPLRTLMVCFTFWLISTEVIVSDQIKFNAKAELLDQATRALGGSRLTVPGERLSNLPGDAGMEKL